MSDIQELRERYEALLRRYRAATQRTSEALGEVKPIGPDGPRMISQEWRDAVDEERAIEPEYAAARDAYWTAAMERRA